MVERYIAQFRLTPEEFNNYSPPPGIDLIVLDWDKVNYQGDQVDAVTVGMVGSDLYPQQFLKKTASDIRHEALTTLKHRILQDNITSHPKMPQRVLKIETLLDHPNVNTGVSRELKMAAEAATEVHDVELTKEEFARIKHHEESGQKLEPKEIRRKHRTITERTAEGKTITRDSGHTEEVYITPFGIVDLG